MNTGIKAYRQQGISESALNRLSLVLILIISCIVSDELTLKASEYSPGSQQNPADKQLLLNGRIWRNEYSKAFGDQFFLTNTFIKGSVIFNGKRFNDLDLMFDIANDELLLKVDSYPVILMNKEMIDSFTLNFGNRNYHIINAGTDTSNVLKGYVNVLYDGTSTLYVKYMKKVQPLAIDGRYDLLAQEHRAYLKKGMQVLLISGKRKLLTLLEDKKKEIRDFLRSGKIKLTRKDPNTYIPLLKYYDSLRE